MVTEDSKSKVEGGTDQYYNISDAVSKAIKDYAKACPLTKS